MKLQRLLETSWSRIAPQMFEATLKNCKALLPFGDIKFRNETLKLLKMSAAQTDHFDHDCNGWQGGWCPGRLEAKSKDVGRSSNGDRASYLKCHRICTTLYFVGTGPVFLLYFFVFLCIATQFSRMQRFTIEFVLQQSILTVVQNTIPLATIAQVSPNCIYIPRFCTCTLHFLTYIS